MSFNIFGIRFYVSYIFVSMLTLFSAIDKTETFIPMIISIAIHEFAHCFMLLMFNCRIKSVKLTIGAVGIEYITPPDKTAVIFSLLAGPIINLVVSFFCLYFRLDTLFGVNLILGIINLLPIIGLDGGSIIDALLDGVISRKAILVLLTVTSGCSVSALLTLNLMCFNNNYSVIIFCTYLILPVFLKILLKEKRI